MQKIVKDRTVQLVRAACVCALGAALCVLMCPADAMAVTAAEKKAEVQSVQAQLSAMEEELEVAVDNYNMANRDYEEAQAKVEECQGKIDKAQDKIDKLQDHLATRASAMYRNGSTNYLDVLMGTTSFGDFATLWDTLNNLNEDDANLVAETKDAKTDLESAKKELDEQEAAAQEALESAASYKSSIESQQSEYEALYNSLSDEYQTLLAEEQAAAEAAAAAAAAAYTPNAYYAEESSGGSGGGYSGGGGGGGGYSSVAYDVATGNAAVDRAYSLMGTPYLYGGASSNGIDCSGLVNYAITGQHGHSRVSQDYWAMSAVSDPQPGDVVACHAGHCGLYIGDGKMIEAPHSGSSVKISNVRGKIVRPS